MGLFEMHMHTAQTSACSQLDAAAEVAEYASRGYAGVVTVDHYFWFFFDRFAEDTPWEEQMDAFLAGYRAAKAEGDTRGLQVLLGMELRFCDGTADDFLVYGITPELLLAYPRLDRYSREEFRRFADEHGLFVAQAHPFRPGCQPSDPRWLHGAEICNGTPGFTDKNPLAQAWAEENGLIGVGGSDLHVPESYGRVAVDFPDPPKDNPSLVRALFERQFEVVSFIK